MACRRLPVLNPLLTDAIGLFEDFGARLLPVPDDNYYPGVEFPLRVINIR